MLYKILEVLVMFTKAAPNRVVFSFYEIPIKMISDYLAEYDLSADDLVINNIFAPYKIKIIFK